ncbi:hypothetical protein H9P43_004306 [Blastocladiella emersonii ATCC 22665]|nr:hypothetical protein H9P43_004306 [Blastocladiella emersonii ATCC 22665]
MHVKSFAAAKVNPAAAASPALLACAKPVRNEAAAPASTVETKLTLLGHIKARAMAGVRRMVPGRNNKQQQQHSRDAAVKAAAAAQLAIKNQIAQRQLFMLMERNAKAGATVAAPAATLKIPVSRAASEAIIDAGKINHSGPDAVPAVPHVQAVEIQAAVDNGDSAVVDTAPAAVPSVVPSLGSAGPYPSPLFTMPSFASFDLGLDKMFTGASDSVAEHSEASSGTGSEDSLDTISVITSADDIVAKEEEEAVVAAMDKGRRDSGAGQEVPAPRAPTAPALSAILSTPYDPVAFETSVAATMVAIDKLVAKFPSFLEDAADKALILAKEFAPSCNASELFVYHRANKYVRPACSMHGNVILACPLDVFRGLAPERLVALAYDQQPGATVPSQRASTQVDFTTHFRAVSKALPQDSFTMRLGVLDKVAALRPQYWAVALVFGFVFMHAGHSLEATMDALNVLWWSPTPAKDSFAVFLMGSATAPLPPTTSSPASST